MSWLDKLLEESTNIEDRRGLTENDVVRKRMGESLLRRDIPPVDNSQPMMLGPVDNTQDAMIQAMMNALKKR